MKKLDDILGGSGQLTPPRSVRLPPLSRTDWEDAVGARVATRTEPYRLDRGVLFVRVASAAWANELAMLTEPIITHLRQQGMDLHSVRFTVGKVQAQPRTRGTPVAAPAPPLEKLPQDVQDAVAAVDQPELREAIAQAALQNLAQHPARAMKGDDAVRSDRPRDRRRIRSASPDRARESPTPGPVSPSPPPASVTRLTPRTKKS
ncbi:MAG: DUF721 domain-containing protein [Deltaproteobacteria bacterium]|nr:DUF721 domain-containing protein [Deltaproteobacteria bacterium]MBW2532549.1 DUF721 domain-containing protein [Deltaproteobacteria bacterium]